MRNSVPAGPPRRGADHGATGLHRLRLHPPRGAEVELFLLASDRGALLLDGSNAPMHLAHPMGKVKLTPETVADYLRLFCFAVRGDEGPFILFEAPVDEPTPEDEGAVRVAAAASPVRLREERSDGKYLLDGNLRFGSTLRTRHRPLLFFPQEQG